MAIRVRYFARVRDLMGRSEELIEAPPEVTDGASLIGYLAGRDGAVAETLAHPSIRIEVNGVLGSRDAAVADGDEVALLPPFSGG